MIVSLRRTALLLFASAATALLLGGCSDLPGIIILSPTHGEFTTDPTVDVSGMVVDVDLADAAVTVNGVPVSLDVVGRFDTTVTLDPSIVFNGIDVELTDTSNGYVTKSRVTVISGDSVADGDFSLESIALRINDSGLDTLENVVTDLVDFDPASLAAPGAVVLDDCVIDSIFGCLGSAVVTVVNPPPSLSSFSLAMDSMTDFVAADIHITDLLLNLHINGSGLVPTCGLVITATTTDIFGDYALSPDAADPTTVDVNQLAGISVAFGNFEDDLNGGICDVPIIGDIIQLFLPDIQTLFLDGFVNLLDDPDGAGPQDAVIADSIEEALVGIEISGPIGQSLGVVLETPMFDIPEDEDGLTLGTDTRVLASIGTGPGQCDAPVGSPDLLASLHVAEPFPSFGALTPGGAPYELGICISTSAFNQLLKAQIECGLLQVDLTEFDLGTGTLVPLNAGILSAFIPELAIFPPASPLVLSLRPTLAPVLTGNPGPNGELAELRVGHLVLELRDPTPGVDDPLLVIAIDFRAGLELLVDDATDQLAPTVASVDPADVSVSIIENLIQTDEATLQAALPTLLTVALPALGSSLGSFPIPSFLDLELEPVEISKNGEFMSIFADLSIPLLPNGNMEDTADGPSDGLKWEGDAFSIVLAENGVTPQNGAGMLRFDATTPGGAAPGTDAVVSQQVDLSAYASQIATGNAVFQATAFFNRIDAGPDTDTQFQVTLEALDGGGSVLGSASRLLASDGDATSWQDVISGILLPTGSAAVRVSLVASEDVLDDAAAPEFDGHYADNARARILPPLTVPNADMENAADLPDDGSGWEGDQFSIVGSENGISPHGGASMLRFDTTDGPNPSSEGAANAISQIDVSNYANLVNSGTLTAHVSAFFNRVDFDAETDTQFFIVIQALDAGGAQLASIFTGLTSDANVATWEVHETMLVLPAATITVQAQLLAFENVVNDATAPEFDGHYADDVRVWLEP
jgi:hypothetical protein